MMILTQRETLLASLQRIGGIVERRQTLPILANILINVKDNGLILTATDLEVEMRTPTPATTDDEIDITLPARKLIDICRTLPEESQIKITVDGERAILRSGKSRFTLGILPAHDYPSIEPTVSSHGFSVSEKLLKKLLEKTQFAMAQQDVRYYLNGMLLEVADSMIRTVATDGHRLALSEEKLEIEEDVDIQVIIPRKAVLELGRQLTTEEQKLDVDISSNHIRIKIGSTTFTSKLIDGKYPDYQRVIPTNTDKEAVADKTALWHALQRTSILSNEKYRGIKFQFMPNMLRLLAHNPEQEEAEEEIEIQYEDEELVIGFNVSYLIEVLNVIEKDKVKILLSDSGSSCLIYEDDSDKSRYVIMPMRL